MDLEQWRETHAVYAYTVLRWGLGVLMFLAGLHKFFNPGDWTIYVADWFTAVWPLPLLRSMAGLGAAEAVIGLAILADYETADAATIAAGFLSVIIFNLLTLGTHVDVLVRNVGLLALAAGVALMAAEQGSEE